VNVTLIVRFAAFLVRQYTLNPYVVPIARGVLTPDPMRVSVLSLLALVSLVML